MNSSSTCPVPRPAVRSQPTVTAASPTAAFDELVIETPERVELYYTRAQIGNRFLAALLDHIIQILVIGGIALALVGLGRQMEALYESLGNWAIALAILVCYGIYTGYFVLFETFWNGQTPGKRVFRLRVIREDGRPVRFFEALVRNLIRIGIDAMPVIVVVPLYSVGIVSIFFSARSKRLGDYVAGTVVIRESETRAPTLDEVASLARETPSSRESAEAAPFIIDPRRLEEAQVRALRAFLRRRYDLPPDARQALGIRTVLSLAATLSIPAVPLGPEAVLEEIDRQYRAHRFYED
jgi:uncharacterized RDD family membrane protein YckC